MLYVTIIIKKRFVEINVAIQTIKWLGAREFKTDEKYVSYGSFNNKSISIVINLFLLQAEKNTFVNENGPKLMKCLCVCSSVHTPGSLMSATISASGLCNFACGAGHSLFRGAEEQWAALPR